MAANPFAADSPEVLAARRAAARQRLAELRARSDASEQDTASLVGGLLGAAGLGLVTMNPLGAVAGWKAGSQFGKGVAQVGQGETAKGIIAATGGLAEGAQAASAADAEAGQEPGPLPTPPRAKGKDKKTPGAVSAPYTVAKGR